MTALERLVVFTFDFFENNETLVRLTRAENTLAGRYVRHSRMIEAMSTPLIDAINGLLRRGLVEGVFREEIDALQLYVSIVTLSAHHISNRRILSVAFGQDLGDPEWTAARRGHAISLVRAYVLKPASSVITEQPSPVSKRSLQ